ncbi:MAG: hypothetical protein ACLRZ2_09020 [Veillonella sp.]
MAHGIALISCKWIIYFDAILYNGTAMTIMESYDEEQVLQYIHDGRINMMSLVPTI